MSNPHDNENREDAEPLESGGVHQEAADAADAVAAEGRSVSDLAPDDFHDALSEAKDRLLRSQAETENVRRRFQREMQEARRFANQPLLVDLLPVLDNMERAISAADQAAEGGGLLEGVKMVYQQLNDALQKHHCQRIQAEGQEFDPAIHEAIAKMPSDDHPAGKVSIVNQHGYQLHDRVIRPAQVVVSSGKSE